MIYNTLYTADLQTMPHRLPLVWFPHVEFEENWRFNHTLLQKFLLLMFLSDFGCAFERFLATFFNNYLLFLMLKFSRNHLVAGCLSLTFLCELYRFVKYITQYTYLFINTDLQKFWICLNIVSQPLLKSVHYEIPTNESTVRCHVPDFIPVTSWFGTLVACRVLQMFLIFHYSQEAKSATLLWKIIVWEFFTMW